MDESPCSKKMKFNSEDYTECSKEELIRIISRLKTELLNIRTSHSHTPQHKKKSKQKSNRTFDFSRHKFRRVAFKLLYLGWNYDGFVTQDNTNNTIEYHLFNALIRARLIEDRSKSCYHRCGRTDQGVSAFSQVISITIRSTLKENQSEDQEIPYCKILNAILPKDIRIIAWAPISEDFSARFSCKKRTYKYWFPCGDLDVKKMNEAAQLLVGRHDFRNLCKMDVGNGVTNFTRHVLQAGVSLCPDQLSVYNPTSKDYSMVEFTVIAEGFLWHQIRAIITIIFLVGQSKEEINIVSELLDVKKYPNKPQYAISSPVPLNLYACEFEDVRWIIDEENVKQIKQSLQLFWTQSAVKCCMIENMLRDLPCTENTVKKNHIYSELFNDIKSKTYKPLMSRPTADSLEDKISHFVKKGKLKINENEET